MRYAVRDAARQRTRTAPAVAAVAATVAGVVALGIGVSSDARENQETYQPSLAMGEGLVAAGYTSTGERLEPDWESLTSVVRRTLPDADTTSVQGIAAADADIYTQVGVPGSRQPVLSSYGSSLGASELVAADALPVLPGLSDEDREQAGRALADGRVVVFSDAPVDSDLVRLRVERYDVVGDGSPSTPIVRETLPATYLPVTLGTASAQLVMPASVARDLGLPVRTVGLLVNGTTISGDEEEQLSQAIAALGAESTLYVERGYLADDFTIIVLLVLGALGGVLVLGGTLTATLLALSDARPDLATLAAVGASPRARRGIAASYAMVVGVVGSVLGATVGFVPGLAAGVTLTHEGSGDYVVEGGGAIAVPAMSGPYLDVPWLLVLALVVVLPLLSAAMVAVGTRSRLPLVARAA
jgi:putative ABC transport system permease protein